jgi:hypothetical protein
VSKKGIGGTVTGLDETWHYQWGHTAKSTIHREIAPMTWGYGAASEQGLAIVVDNHKVTHVMGFNEPDDCHGQSGQYNNLCQVDVAVARYENLMTTGLRLVSPGPREQGPFGWLKEFHEKATEQNIRIDVIAVHWYDWGGNPQNTPNANPQQVFNRFKNYLNNVYDHYQLPIWITEFNANPNRTTAVQEGFMALALPYLESLDYVERYAWFQPSSGTGQYYDGNGNYTPLGSFYKNQESTPSVKGHSLMSSSNLDGKEPDNVSSGNTGHAIPSTSLKVYPNPVADMLHLETHHANDDTIRIYNLTGTLVKQLDYTPEINVSPFIPGVYFLRINNSTIRFVKI